MGCIVLWSSVTQSKWLYSKGTMRWSRCCDGRIDCDDVVTCGSIAICNGKRILHHHRHPNSRWRNPLWIVGRDERNNGSFNCCHNTAVYKSKVSRRVGIVHKTKMCYDTPAFVRMETHWVMSIAGCFAEKQQISPLPGGVLGWLQQICSSCG